jgi:hypothetical protein
VRRHTAYLRNAGHAPDARPYDVFVSFHQPDRHVAELVVRSLVGAFGARVFFAPESLPEHPGYWLETVLAALQSARCLISIGTEPQHCCSEYVKFEALVFQQEKLRDPARLMIPVIGFSPDLLPWPLCLHQAVPWEGKDSVNSVMRAARASIQG